MQIAVCNSATLVCPSKPPALNGSHTPFPVSRGKWQLCSDWTSPSHTLSLLLLTPSIVTSHFLHLCCFSPWKGGNLGNLVLTTASLFYFPSNPVRLQGWEIISCVCILDIFWDCILEQFATLRQKLKCVPFKTWSEFTFYFDGSSEQ